MFDGTLEELKANPIGNHKIFAPDGTYLIARGWLGLLKDGGSNALQLWFLHEDGEQSKLSHRVVVYNLDEDAVIYNPRNIDSLLPFGFHMSSVIFMTRKDKAWLKANPSWPEILELTPNPVADGDGTGLFS